MRVIHWVPFDRNEALANSAPTTRHRRLGMRYFVVVAAFLPIALGASLHPRVTSAPTIQLDRAEFTGLANSTVAEFLGIPFGQSTAGKNRLHLPQPVGPYTGGKSATSFGPACPQQNTPTAPSPPGIFDGIPPSLSVVLGGPITDISEDCLSLNVFKPLSAKQGDKLPVVAWIYGGGFQAGASSLYDGSIIVNRSIATGQPIIFVSMNYRVAAWGFLGGKEVKEAGVANLGLEDQRLALKWIQKYISHFGGDSSKVTIWGQSAGSASVSMQMLTNGGNTEGLFRAAFMQSGGPLPVGDTTEFQPFYDMLVNATGCSGAQDTLACLRSVSGDVFQAGVNTIPSGSGLRSLHAAFQPSVDGRFLNNDPQKLVLEGSVANIPFVSGNNDDEGTLFTAQLTNFTTDDVALGYIHDNYLTTANQSVMDTVAKLYPSDPAAGSPFDTGSANAFTPEFKRLAAFQGDLIFLGPRRLFVNARAPKQPVWSFLNKRFKDIQFLGTFHGSDLIQTLFAHAELQDYLLNFINNLDPNKGNQGSNSTGHSSEKLISWPKFSTSSKQLLTILDGDVPLEITKDDFREEAIQFLLQYTLANPL